MLTNLPTGPLVSTAWLAEHLAEPLLRVVDMRGIVLPPTEPKPHYFARHEDYAAGHIPGAVYIDWTQDITDPADPVPVQVAPPERIAALFSRLGIGDDTVVVAYDDNFSMFAGRLLWVLRYYGHERAYVLDGGLVKWLAEGRPLTATPPDHAPATFTPHPQPALRRTADQVLAHLGDPGTLLLDARSAAEFSGSESRAARGGHIPGAVNAFYREFIAEAEHTYLPPAELRTRLEAAGLDLAQVAAQDDVVVYCNGGVSATPLALAVEIATGRRPALYDGSWNEWGNDEKKPIADSR